METFDSYFVERRAEKTIINYQDSEDISQVLINLFSTDNFKLTEIDTIQQAYLFSDERDKQTSLNNADEYFDECWSYFGSSENKEAENLIEYYDQDMFKNKNKRLFVKNFPYGTKLAKLLPIFESFGILEKKLCRLIHRKGHFNYAFVEFLKEDDAQRAQRGLDNCLFNESGRKLTVQFARPKLRDPNKMVEIKLSSKGKLCGGSFYGLGGQFNHGTKKSRKKFRELWKTGQIVTPQQVIATKNQLFVKKSYIRKIKKKKKHK